MKKTSVRLFHLCSMVPQTYRKNMTPCLCSLIDFATRVLQAGERGKIITYIVCSAITYGPNTGPSPNLGVAYNIFTSNAKAHGFVPYVGDGTAVASAVSPLPPLCMKPILT